METKVERNGEGMDKKWRANGEENKNGERMDKVILLKSDDSSKHDQGYHFYKNYICRFEVDLRSKV